MVLVSWMAQAATQLDNVDVHYKDPQHFTEAKLDAGAHLVDVDAYLKPLKDYIAERALRVLARGLRLVIEVTDVKSRKGRRC